MTIIDSAAIVALMPITEFDHRDVKPTSLVFPPKWQDKLDQSHVEQLAIQIASGQRLYVTTDSKSLVLKGRHTSAAYLKVAKGFSTVGPDGREIAVPPQPKIKVPVIRIKGTAREERILHLSSIVNQRMPDPVERKASLKELVELMEAEARDAGAPITRAEAVDKTAKAAGKSSRTVQRDISDKPEPTKESPAKATPKPAKPAPATRTITVTDEKGETLVKGGAVVKDTNPTPPRDVAILELDRCLTLLEHLKIAQTAAMNACFALSSSEGQAGKEAADQLNTDQSTIVEMEADYKRFRNAIHFHGE